MTFHAPSANLTSMSYSWLKVKKELNEGGQGGHKIKGRFSNKREKWGNKDAKVGSSRSWTFCLTLHMQTRTIWTLRRANVMLELTKMSNRYLGLVTTICGMVLSRLWSSHIQFLFNCLQTYLSLMLVNQWKVIYESRTCMLVVLSLQLWYPTKLNPSLTMGW